MDLLPLFGFVCYLSFISILLPQLQFSVLDSCVLVFSGQGSMVRQEGGLGLEDIDG